jgi:hypothetical protein
MLLEKFFVRFDVHHADVYLVAVTGLKSVQPLFHFFAHRAPLPAEFQDGGPGLLRG